MKRVVYLVLMLSHLLFAELPSQRMVYIGSPVCFGVYDAAGFSDWIYYGNENNIYHPYDYHEVLSGEWAAAIYYDGIDTSPINPADPSSGNQAMWLTDLFLYPNWNTNSDFIIDLFSDSWDTPENPVPSNNPAIYYNGRDLYSIANDTGKTIIANNSVEIAIDYEVVDLAYNDPNSGVWLGAPIEFFTNNQSSVIFSDRYLFLQTYTIRNITEQTITGFEFYQMLHSHGADEYNAAVHSVYSNSGTYYDPLSDYSPFNPIHTTGDFKYQITQWNNLDEWPITANHVDYVCFASTTEPDFIENGYFIGHSGKPARPGTHWNIEERNLNGELESYGEVAGAMGWRLGDLDPNQTSSITIAFMFAHGEPIVCSLEVELTNFTDPNSFLAPEDVYCGIDPSNPDPNFYTVDYEIYYANPITDPYAPNYIGTIDDAVLVAHLPADIWLLPSDIISSGGNYNIFERTITWNIGELNPGESGYTYFTIKIMDTATPGGEVITSATLSSSAGWVKDTDYSPVCCWCNTVYVDTAAYGGFGSNGTSWDKAYKNLADALDRISQTACGDEVWIAKGTYYPYSGSAFELPTGVSIYGGFAAEQSETTIQCRDVLKNKTTLAGSGDYTLSANSVEDSTIDGLTITGGAKSGIRLQSSDVLVSNCIIAGNGESGIEITSGSNLELIKSLVSDNGGDGIKASSSTFEISQTMLRNNNASGLKINSLSSPSTIANSIITANETHGIENSQSSRDVSIINCSIISNSGRGVIGSNAAEIYNSIIWHNGVIDDPNSTYTYYDKLQCLDNQSQYSCLQDPNDIEGNAPGADIADIDGNITANPEFYFEPSSYVYYLRSTSPCRDNADNTAVYGNTDYYGQSRIINDYADMGAVEYSGVQDCEDCDFNRNAAVDFSDFRYIANSWLADTSDPRYNIELDLYPDGVIDDGDIVEFIDCWLWEPPFILMQEVMQIAHRSTGLFAIEPAEPLEQLLGEPITLATLNFDSSTRQLSAISQEPAKEQYQQPLVENSFSSKPKPPAAQAADIAITVEFLDAIYATSPEISGKDIEQYQQFRESLISAYYELLK